MSGKQGRASPLAAGREGLSITCGLDDTVRAEAVSLQVWREPCTAEGHSDGAGHPLSLSRTQELSASSQPDRAILERLTGLICASQWEPPKETDRWTDGREEDTRGGGRDGTQE